MKQVLIIDDDEDVAMLLSRFTQKAGFSTQTVSSLKKARALLETIQPDLILLDLRLPDGSGLDFLPELRGKYPTIPVIMCTGEGEVDHAVRAMRSGAADFLLKPVDGPTLTRAVQQAAGGPTTTVERPSERTVIGDSAALREVFAQLDVFAKTDITILLLGESGTGKELFARAVHARSKRKDGPFIELDCASIAPSLIESELFGHEKGAFTDAREARAGKFELASGGTLFLDEIGNLSHEVQAKLLRVVQERRFRRLGGEKSVQVDVRIVAATNLDLEDASRRGAFRQDLFFRLAELPLQLPPLRDRAGDVKRLVEHFVKDFANRYERPVPFITPEAMRLLEAHPWPGNVRELLNVVRVATLRATDRLGVESLPGGFGKAGFSTTSSSVDVRASAAAPVTPATVTPDQDAPAGAPASGAASAAPSVPGAPAVTHTVTIPWPERDEDGLDLKKFLADVRADLEVEILAHLLRARGMSKAQMARYLKLDYKVMLEKLRQYGLTPPTAQPDADS